MDGKTKIPEKPILGPTHGTDWFRVGYTLQDLTFEEKIHQETEESREKREQILLEKKSLDSFKAELEEISISFDLKCIVAEKESKLTYFKPYEAQLPQIHKKSKKEGKLVQPLYSSEWMALPHIALANINCNKEEEVLGFVNSWGLLGLWNVKKYKDWRPLLLSKSVFNKPNDKYYINPLYVGVRKPSQYHKYQEPINVFKTAVKEYQGVSKILLFNEKPNTQGDLSSPEEAYNKTPSPKEYDIALELIQHYTGECQFTPTFNKGHNEQPSSYWRFPSLLHICYMRLWEDIEAKKKFKKCEHRLCKNVFVAERPNEKYCSDGCKKNAKQYRQYHKIRS